MIRLQTIAACATIFAASLAGYQFFVAGRGAGDTDAAGSSGPRPFSPPSAPSGPVVDLGSGEGMCRLLVEGQPLTLRLGEGASVVVGGRPCQLTALGLSAGECNHALRCTDF